MKRTLAWFGLVLLIVGALLVPALHAVHVAEHGGADDRDGSGHNADHCQLCQLAQMPIATAGPAAVLSQGVTLCGAVQHAAEAPALAQPPRIHASRAPPSPF